MAGRAAEHGRVRARRLGEAVTTRRVALVTGAARGIGSAIAARLARTGHHVAVADLDLKASALVAERIVAAGGSASAWQLDVTDEGAVELTVERLVAEHGSIGIVVNNAGVTRDNLIHKMTWDDWSAVQDVHLGGAFLVSRAAQRSMVATGWGRIVNLSSVSAFGNRGQANYSAAKAGLLGFTRTLALELGRFGITVNAVLPGFIDTAMTRATAERMGLSPEEFAERMIQHIAVGRVGSPDDVAALVGFLTSDEAGFVTGQGICVSGNPGF
ncbi:3-oxoacyl-ACP reductase FabG [Streptomyces sp. NPDC008343]|uniref:3-oxoacyl-ACP reductase FabG n=1 Tax=Streptomyces sp. NPDC008343 TaxID=3364828 RepID=UPI0036E9E475